MLRGECPEAFQMESDRQDWERLTSRRTVPHKPSETLLRTVAETVAEVLHRGTLRMTLPSPTMPTFLTVKEAARLTGKSPSSIRRIIYPILKNNSHPDRVHIQPNVED